MVIRRTKRLWILILLIAFGMLIGNVVADMSRGSRYFYWLAYGRSFGVSTDSPFVLDLGMLTLKLGLMVHLTISSIVGIIAALMVYRRI